MPADVFMLDRDETLLHDLELSLDGKGLLTSEKMVLADIRDKEWIQELVSRIKPDIIFHAAALKHLPMLEQYPEEAEKTNVQGTKNLLDAAQASGTSIFVNISTDKAVRPISQLGISKRKAELLTYQTGAQAGEDKKYVSVRFGNVLGSRGSVLDTFRLQIKNGGPITLTDLKVKRYFMTIPEAVHLVLEASTKGTSGDVMLLDMGEPILIKDIADKLIKKSGKKIQIVVTGLRVGEKLSEDLFDDGKYIQVNETHKLKIEKLNSEE
jgi:dTDP-glucose 4,6-dehydratase